MDWSVLQKSRNNVLSGFLKRNLHVNFSFSVENRCICADFVL